MPTFAIRTVIEFNAAPADLMALVATQCIFRLWPCDVHTTRFLGMVSSMQALNMSLSSHHRSGRLRAFCKNDRSVMSIGMTSDPSRKRAVRNTVRMKSLVATFSKISGITLELYGYEESVFKSHFKEGLSLA